MSQDTPDFPALMQALDAEGTYMAMLEQNAALTAQDVDAEIAVMAGAPLSEEREPLAWVQPARGLARWARDAVLRGVLEAGFSIEGQRVLIQVRLLPTAPANLSELDLYMNGRLVAEFPVTPDMRAYPDGLGTLMEADLPSLPEGPVMLELCQVNRVLATAEVTPAPPAGERTIEGGFGGIRKGMLAIWGVDRDAPDRPVIVSVSWNGTERKVILDTPAGFSKADVLGGKLSLRAAEPGRDHRVVLTGGARRQLLKRGAFSLRRERDTLFLWVLHRLESGGLFGTVIATKDGQSDPHGPVRVGLDAGGMTPATLRDHPAFAFQDKSNSFHFPASAVAAAEAAGGVRLCFADPSGVEVMTDLVVPADLGSIPDPAWLAEAG